MFDGATAILKIASMVASALFGALGLLTEYKGKDGTITRWGKVALSGIVLSALLSLTLQWLETEHAKREANDARQKADATAASLRSILFTSRRTVLEQNRNLRETEAVAEKLEATARQNQQLTANMAHSLAQGQQTLANTHRLATSLSTSLAEQQDLILLQRSLQRNVMRAYYPLEPVVLEYEIEYCTDDHWLREYIKRIQSLAVDDDDNKYHTWDITQRGGQWLPGNEGDEANLRKTLLEDNLTFVFNTPDQAHSLQFVSAPTTPEYTGPGPIHPPIGKLFQLVTLDVNFRVGLLRKHVRCENPIRVGNDWRAISSVDLIGRNITWYRPLDIYGPDPKPLWLRLHFTYNPESQTPFISLDKSYPIAILPEDIGLADIPSIQERGPSR